MATNVIYDAFITTYVQHNIYLVPTTTHVADTFKLALLKYDFTPNKSTQKYFLEIQQAGHEITGSGYTEGGKSLSFTEVSSPTTAANIVKYRGSAVVWDPASFTAKYAVIYRESDGLLISCYDFGANQTVTGGKFEIDWTGTYTLAIDLSESGGGGGSITVDEDLSKNSTNPLTNRKTTETFGSLGIAMEDEAVPGVIEDQVDRLKKIDDKVIEDMFK